MNLVLKLAKSLLMTLGIIIIYNDALRLFTIVHDNKLISSLFSSVP